MAVVCLPAAALPQGYLAERTVQPIIIGAKKAAQLVAHQPVPEYPPLAKVNYIQGRVQLGIEVTADGKVAHAHVLGGYPLLAASALETIRTWTYTPLITPAGPSAFVTTVDMNYSLRIHMSDVRPTQAERDLSRQVKPPEVIRRPENTPLKTLVHMHLLLNDQGRVIDSEPPLETVSRLTPGNEVLQGWAFRPARWGSLPVPWYLDVEVPVSEARAPQASADPQHR